MFLGFIETEGHLSIVTECMGGGDLSTYLCNPEKQLTVDTVFSYILQVAEGMTYLYHKKILHRDLAARNCLLNETYNILKISDFGLSKEMNINYEYICHENSVLPFKILPVEELALCFDKYRTITSQGDIWAFGILLWEMFERGGKVYNGINNIFQLSRFLNSGKRLFRPKNCPNQLYSLMLRCWDRVPKNRPIFDVIKLNIKQIYDEIKEIANNCLNIQIEMSGSSDYSRVNINADSDIKPYLSYMETFIFIKGSNGKFMSGENGLRPLTCDRKEANNWEMFIVENFGSGIIALKSRDSYVSSKTDPVICDQKIVTDSEKFEWIDNPDGTFSLKSNNDKFLSRDNGEGLMSCESNVNGKFEKFTYINYSDMPSVGATEDTVDGNSYTFIKGSNGKYVSSKDGYSAMKCDRVNPNVWERFDIENLGDGFIALKCNGKYVSSENGEKPMMCNRATVLTWEKFEIIGDSGGMFSLRGENGLYVTVSSAAVNYLLYCNGNSSETAEKFSFCL